MPNTHETLASLFNDIADAIRSKDGTSADIVADTFPDRINAIQTGTDVSDTTATAGDVLTDKYFYTSNGTKTEGTIVTKTSSDLTVNGAIVTAPAGYYASNTSKSVTSGSATTPATSVSPASGSGSINSSTGVVTYTTGQATKSVTPTVSAGYVSSGTAGTITVPATSFTYQLPTTKAATTYNTKTSNQTIAAGTYLTGKQTIRAVTTSGIDEANIKSGTTVTVGDAASAGRIKNVTGTFSASNTITGTGKTAASASDIRSGKSAFLNGSQLDGTADYATASVSGTKLTLTNGFPVANLVDVSDTTATANDVMAGKYFYNASGIKTEGSYVLPDASIDTLKAQPATNTATTYTYTTTNDYRVVVAAIYGTYKTWPTSGTYVEPSTGDWAVRIYVNLPAGSTFTAAPNPGYNNWSGLYVYGIN